MVVVKVVCPVPTELTGWSVMLFRTRLLFALGSKLAPVMVTTVPETPTDGVKLVMLGALEAATVKFKLLVAVPDESVTRIGPVVAPVGTAATSWFGLAELTVAVTPLNCTVFCEAVGLKPVPLMVTFVPTGPLPGANCMMETCVGVSRVMDRIFPTAS